ncbi:YrdB family protein [Nocardia sp. NPDC051463]|uniref:YrdB family protein n=1 Tax=Nocardia sp. NPDC051463 TaxID=3154845 RepID=UPI00344D146E
MFLLELGVLVGVGLWGFMTPADVENRVRWAGWTCPVRPHVGDIRRSSNPRFPLHGGWRPTVELLWFGGGALACAQAMRPIAGLMFWTLWGSMGAAGLSARLQVADAVMTCTWVRAQADSVTAASSARHAQPTAPPDCGLCDPVALLQCSFRLTTMVRNCGRCDIDQKQRWIDCAVLASSWRICSCNSRFSGIQRSRTVRRPDGLYSGDDGAQSVDGAGILHRSIHISVADQ